MNEKISITNYLFFCRPKAKDFSKVGTQGSASSRRDAQYECDIDNMSFENIFDDLLNLTSENESEEEE